jgi:ElaA protein
VTGALTWRWRSWRDLDADTLHAIFKLRSDVFVVEQNCVFSEMDGFDPQCDHLCAIDAQGRLLAYLRLLPPGAKYQEPSIGRVVVAADARKHGLARKAMLDGIKRCGERFPDQPILIQAQQYLERFYLSLGFEAVGAPYLEDGIAHVDMRRSPTRMF